LGSLIPFARGQARCRQKIMIGTGMNGPRCTSVRHGHAGGHPRPRQAAVALMLGWIPAFAGMTLRQQCQVGMTNGKIGFATFPHSMAGLDPAIQSHTLGHRCTLSWMAASEGGHDERAEIRLAVLKVRPLLRVLREGYSRTRAARRCHRAPSHRDVRDEASCRARGPSR